MSIIRRKFILRALSVNDPTLGDDVVNQHDWCVIQTLTRESEMVSSFHSAILTPPWDGAENSKIRKFTFHVALFGANYLVAATSPPPATIPSSAKIPMFARPDPLFVFNRWLPTYYNSAPDIELELQGPLDQMAQNLLTLTIDLRSPIRITFPGPDCYFEIPIRIVLEGRDDNGRSHRMIGGPVLCTTSTFVYQAAYSTDSMSAWNVFILGFSLPGKNLGPYWTHAIWFTMDTNTLYGTVSRVNLNNAISFNVN
jgi:hypothetical protein